MKVVVSDCSWNNYDVEIETLKKAVPDVEVVCAQVDHTDEDALIEVLKDADAATESSNYIKYQILQQATATLLATANQQPQIALNLL